MDQQTWQGFVSMPPGLRSAALHLAIIQFFFFTTWIVYVVFLADLLERVGLGQETLIWFILLDQAVFSISDIVLGYSADLMERIIGRLGSAIIGVNLVSCTAFLLLPLAADLQGDAAPAIFTGLIVVWIATSSVLRAPPIVLLMKYAARPQAPSLAALSLLGLALGGAVSPYLGLWLKGQSPYLPFVVSSLTLAAVTFGLVRVQRIVAALPAEARDPGNSVPAPVARIALMMAGTLLLGFGFQLHYFMNTKPQYLQFLEPADSIWVLPVFWIGFKLLMFPGTSAARRFGPLPVMGVAALIGGTALLGCLGASSLQTLLFWQLLAGGAWGMVFMAGISAALNLGSNGHEGLVLGTWFTVLSIAAMLRVALVAGGAKTDPNLMIWLQWMPLPLWLLGGSALLFLSLRPQRARGHLIP